MFTERKWARLKNARITCLDYSIDMLAQAEKRLRGYSHIQCVQGDVGKLQMAGEAFDLVVSMNGFHAFPDKQKAFGETWRVLKPGGTFIACFYIWGKSRRTDWLVKTFSQKRAGSPRRSRRRTNCGQFCRACTGKPTFTLTGRWRIFAA